MIRANIAWRYALSALVAAGCLTATLPEAALARVCRGITIFGGADDGEDELGFCLDSGRQGGRDRYKLRIPAEKLEYSVQQFVITYPDHYDGSFDVELDPEDDPDDQKVEVRVGRGDSQRSVLLRDVVWDEENHRIEIYPAEPVPANQKVELVFHRVRNPRFGGMFFFNSKVYFTGDVPLLRNLGVWILTIGV